MFALKQEDLPRYTRADYEMWEGNWELIDGIPFAMAPSPTWQHQEINTNLIVALVGSLKTCSNCRAIMPVNYKLAENTILQPDALVVCEPFDKGLYLTKTPEIIFEILSPSTAQKDQSVKFDLYATAGIKYYIIIFPTEKKAEIFRLDETGRYALAGTLATESYEFETSGCNFTLDFGKIWQ